MAVLHRNRSLQYSWRRWLGAAICALVGSIMIAGNTAALATPRQSTAAAPKNTQLTVLSTGPIGFGTGPAEFPLRIVMPGPAFKGTATLVDSAGLNQTTVRSAPLAYCLPAVRRHIAADSGTAGTSASEWCLRMRGLKPGSQVTGNISTPKIRLKLTLGVRHNYWFGPALVTLAALGLAVAGVLLLGPDALGGFMRRRRLQAALVGNRQRLEKGNKAIQGLDQQWVDKVGRAGVDISSATFVWSLRDVIKQGPDHADDERETLRKHLGDPALPAKQPLRDAAQREASTPTYQVADFLDDNGTRVPHPASEWLMTIKRAERLRARLDTLDRSLDGMFEQDSRTKDMLKRRLAAARTSFAEVGDADGLDDVDGLADAVLLASNEAVGQAVSAEEVEGLVRAGRDEEEPAVTTTGLAGLAILSARRLARLEVRRTSRVLGTERWWPTLLASGAILAAIVFVMIIAAGSVAVSSYATNPTFGTTADYVKLFFVALGSSVVTGLVSTILLWSPRSTQ
jgi:hypothetical protein